MRADWQLLHNLETILSFFLLEVPQSTSYLSLPLKWSIECLKTMAALMVECVLKDPTLQLINQRLYIRCQWLAGWDWDPMRSPTFLLIDPTFLAIISLGASSNFFLMHKQLPPTYETLSIIEFVRIKQQRCIIMLNQNATLNNKGASSGSLASSTGVYPRSTTGFGSRSYFVGPSKGPST